MNVLGIISETSCVCCLMAPCCQLSISFNLAGERSLHLGSLRKLHSSHNESNFVRKCSPFPWNYNEERCKNHNSHKVTDDSISPESLNNAFSAQFLYQRALASTWCVVHLYLIVKPCTLGCLDMLMTAHLPIKEAGSPARWEFWRSPELCRNRRRWWFDPSDASALQERKFFDCRPV
jgi:hypothetical protein